MNAPAERLTARGHRHVEAFCLMWYACPCGHQERIWNSRDGVTPFGMQCPSCGSSEMRHVRWQSDTYAPAHEPLPGRRQWISMTRERAERIARARIAGRVKALDDVVLENLTASIYHDGEAPDLIVTAYSGAEA